MNDTLTHYGVLGMKWGVRRYQNKDGTLTKAGQARYNPEVEKAKTDLSNAKSARVLATKDYYRATRGGLVANKTATDKLNKAVKRVGYAKEDLSDAKAKARMETQSKKSERQLRFEQKYKEQGMTQAEAELAAYKRVRTEKIIAVTAGLALTATAAYAAYKYHDNYVDKVIKSGTSLQNISKDSNKGVSDAFYASMNKWDNSKYRGFMPEHIRNQHGMGTDIFEAEIGVKSGLKVASKKSATQVLGELVKSDKTYANTLESQLRSFSGHMATRKQNKLIDKALRSLKAGKVDFNVYDAVNLGLTSRSGDGKTISRGLYDSLKSKGYDAIKDVNDLKYSGYKSINPIVVFNGSSKTAVNSVRKLGKEEVTKKLNLHTAELITRAAVKMGAAIVAGQFGIVATTKAVQSKSNAKYVSEYRKQHPNSTLSYNEIVRNREKG